MTIYNTNPTNPTNPINPINTILTTYYIKSVLSILSENDIPHTYNPTTNEITTPYIIIDLNSKLVINAFTGEILFDEPILYNNKKDSFYNYIEIFPAIYMATKMEMEGGEE